MNFFRRILSAISFGIFATREAARTWSPDRSRLRTHLQSARMDWSACDRETVQAKCRFFEENTGLVQRMASVFETYTAGNGLVLTPASSDPMWNAAAKEAWESWCQFPDLNSRQTFASIQSLWARRWFVDGEIFVLLTYSQESKRPRIQNIEAHLCKTPPELAQDAGVCDGVRFNADGRPVGYYLGSEDVKGKFICAETPTSADFVLHIFEPERSGQVRGTPFLSSVLNELHDLDDLRMLEMRAAKEEAKTVNIIKTRPGEMDAAGVIRQRFNQSTTISTGATVTESRSDFVSTAVGGESIALLPDEDMQRIAGVRPSKASMDYWTKLEEEICIGCDIPHVIVFPDSMQGTVYRGSLDMAAANFRARSSVIAAASRRVFEYVIEREIKSAKQRRPDGSLLNPILANPPGDWRNVTVSCPRSPNVDVGRNSAAMIEELKNGLSNYDLVYGPLGLNWEVEMGKLEAQLQTIETKFPRVAQFLAAQNPPAPADPAAEAMRAAQEDAIPA